MSTELGDRGESNGRLLYGIISTRRPQNVAHMQELVNPDIWVVNDSKDYHDYKEAGANYVATNRSHPASAAGNRNYLLNYAEERACWIAIFDDDINKFYSFDGRTNWTIAADTAVHTICGHMMVTGATLGGVGRTVRSKNQGQDVKTWGLLSGTTMVVDPSDGVRFQENQCLKFVDDVDFSCRKMAETGHIIKVEWLTADSHVGSYTIDGEGGHAEDRTLELQEENVKYVLRLWSHMIKRSHINPKGIMMRNYKPTWPDSAKEAYKKLQESW